MTPYDIWKTSDPAEEDAIRFGEYADHYDTARNRERLTRALAEAACYELTGRAYHEMRVELERAIRPALDQVEDTHVLAAMAEVLDDVPTYDDWRDPR